MCKCTRAPSEKAIKNMWERGLNECVEGHEMKTYKNYIKKMKG